MAASQETKSEAGATHWVTHAPDCRLNQIRLAVGAGAVQFNITSLIGFGLLTMLYVAVRAWRLTWYGLYGDETFTVHVARGDWAALTDQVVADVVHPPLFYFLLKIWIAIGGDSELWLKLLPFLISVAAIAPFYLLCRELRMKPYAVNLALGLMAVNAFLIYHSQELRMYSLLALLAITSLWLFAKLFNSASSISRIQIALFMVNLLLIYTHYYGWAIVGIEFLFLLLLKRDRLLAFSMGVAALIVCFSPWAYAVYKAAINKGGLEPNLGWNRPPDITKLAAYFGVLLGGMDERLFHLGAFYQLVVKLFRVLAFLFVVPIAIWGWKASKEKERSEANAFWWLFALSFLPAVASFIISQALPQSVWAMRYLIISAPFFIMLQAIAFARLNPKALRRVAVCFVLGWAMVTGLAQTANRDRVPLEPLAHQLIQAEAMSERVTKIYTNRGGENVNVANTIQFYLAKMKETRLRVEFVNDYTEPMEDRFWIVFMKYAQADEQKIEQELAARGYVIGEALRTKAVTYEIVLLPVYRQRAISTSPIISCQRARRFSV